MIRRFVLFSALICVVLLAEAVCSLAQQPATGLPPLASFGGGPFDVVNLANLDVHFAIPVFNRAGRGIAFNYSLGYDSLVWVPQAPNGASVWTPVASSSGSGPIYNWGWRAVTEAATGYVSYATFTWSQSCQTGPLTYGITTSTWGGLVYHDPSGGFHTLPPGNNSITEVSITSSSCGTVGTTISPVMKAVPQDNSGYIVSTSSSSALGPATVSAQGGVTIVTPSVGASTGAGSVTDANGNQISINSSGVITDTLGTALTVSGTPPANVTYTYTAPSGAQASVTLIYGTYYVQTCFQVSGITEFPDTKEYLINEIQLPDGSSYQVSYEATVGCGTSGKTTGRIASISLATGGTICYLYGTGSCGDNTSNSMMADGSPAAMSRTMSGTSVQTVSWTYGRQLNSNGGGNPQFTATSIEDSAGNWTYLNFNGVYQTQQTSYQGAPPQRNALVEYNDML